MRLAILMTNTDESVFSSAHPKDGEKFADLVGLVRPDWQCEVFAVKDGIFPDDVAAFDGVMITGSPASVHYDIAWIGELFGVVREAHAQGIPMFGACFGHQAIAMALGGRVEHNPGGWEFGRITTRIKTRKPWMSDLGEDVSLYAAHMEQVVRLPEGAKVLSSSGPCAYGGFAIGDAIYTTQYHPEMTSDFIAALVEHLAEELPADVIARARGSLDQPADMVAFAESIARFFEHNQAQSRSGF